MNHKILKRKGKNTQPESSFRREHKGLLRRISAFVIAAAVMTTGMPMQQIADNMPDLDIISKISGLIPDAAMKAAAAEPQHRDTAKDINIASGADLVAYVNGTLEGGYNEKDNITITISDSIYNLKGFVGIGTAEYPFAGTITIGQASNTAPYGDLTKLTWENSSLFNYVTTDAVITNGNTSDSDKPVYFKTSGTGTAPLFAKHVVAGDNDTPQTWHIVVEASTQYGGVIGDLGEGAKAKIHLGYLNQNSEVKRDSDAVGGICGTMGENSALNLWLDKTIKDTSGKDATSQSLGNITANKFAGGIIGQMNTGAILTINEMPEITGERMITATDGNSGNAAGGLVGKADSAKIEFAKDVSYTNRGTLNATVTNAPTASGAGGVFGVYSAAEGAEFDIDLSDYKLTGTINVSANAGGGFAGRFELKGNDTESSAAKITIYNETAKDANSDVDFKVKSNKGTVGGIIGKILNVNGNLKNTFTIKNVKTELTLNGDNSQNGGGIVGDLGLYRYSSGRTYLKIDGTNNITINKGEAKGNTGGIAYSVYSSFLDICGENTINGRVKSGVVDKVVDCSVYGSVVRFSGKTDLSGVEDVKTALLVNLQTDGGKDDGLIYALGSGSDYDSAKETGWTYIRPAKTDTKIEDVSPWGQVIRLVGGKTIEEADVVSYDKTAHTVTLNSLNAENNEYKIANTVDFMKLALCIQHNTATKKGAFTNSGKSNNILKNNVIFNLNKDIDLSGTGLRGLTRDNGANDAFTGTFNGNGHKITLAIGEAYGYRGSSTTPAKNEAGKDNGNIGAVYDHKYQGLFAKVSDATINDLTLDGSICIEANADDIYCGAAAAQFSGNTTAENVKSNVNIIMKKDAHRIDIGTIFGVDSATANVTLNNCTSNFEMTLAGNANSSYNGVSAGTIGHVKNSGSNVTVNGITVSGEMKNSIASRKDGDKTYYFYGYGGLIGVVEHQSTKHEIKLKDVKVSNFTITDNSNNNGTGGLLGGSWNNVNVTIGDNSSHDKGVTVDGSKITVENSTSKTIGGLVTSSYGYWQVNSLKYTSSSITDSSSSVVGLIVGKGYEDRTLPNTTETNNTEINNAVEPKRLYLEITDPSAYDCSGMTYIGSANTYDEIVGRTMKERDDDDIGASGEGIVSIRTSGDKLNMDNSNSNEYKPQTDFGKTADANPYTRYYYNLDYLRANTSLTGGEKAVLWSVYTYASKNIRKYFKNYSTFPTDTEIDLTGLSYYPVDVDASISLSGANVKLYNEQIQNAHGTKYSTRAYSQHYLMQCGLFRNVTKNITLTNCTISGTAAAYRNSLASATEKLNVQGSGALICGNLEGSSTPKASLTISGLVLDGITIKNLNEADYNTANMALLVRNIGSYTETKISGVSTSGYADNEKAASALIGTAGSDTVQQMSIQFEKMCLDGRSATTNVSDAAQTVFKEKYGTASSIFTQATLIHTLQYTSEGGSSAIYNYNYDEDWNADGTAKHNVTYGKEISHSKEFAPDAEGNDQRRYLDMHAADDTNHFTSPENPKATEVFNFSNFLPYVATEYGGSVTNAHEIAVNHVSKEMGKGCGTYNDPFIIDDGTTLSLVADILSSGTFSKGFSMYIDNDYLSSKNKNFEKWDSDKAKGTGHTRIEYNGSKFVAVKKSGTEWVEDTNKSITISTNEVRAYLAGAYYLVEGNDENDGIITLSDKFAGLGQTGSDYAFRGVIAGKDYNGNKMVIENPSDKPFVSVSNGCVVKDLDIKVTAQTITLTNDKNGKSGQLSYEDGTPVYGAVIGKILGGDNIIDGVSVAFSNTTKIQLKTTVSTNNYYKYTTVIPVGGYVGAVVNGGLVFRNMGSEKISPLSNVTFEVYKNTNEQIPNVDVLDKYLYVNQIVGRVVNAYCFNETDSYSKVSKILDNGENNYPIPDLNPDSKNKISFTQEDGKTVETMVVPDSQSLFILSEITQSMCGNADTPNGSYTVKNSYGEKNKTTHLAKYSAVGTDDTTQPNDFTLAKEDSSGKTNAVPYIISQYTAAENGNYPARAITGSGNYHYMKLAENAKYDLPNCFRGIGQFYPQEMSDSDICKNILALYGLDGNGSTINLNTNLKNHSSEWDCYYKNYLKGDNTNNADKIGFGLFNDLYFDVSGKGYEDHQAKSKHKESDITKTNSIHDLTLSGTLSQKQYENGNKITLTDPLKAANTGGIIGALTYTKDKTSRVYNFWNVSLDDLDIYGERATGGFIGYTPNVEQYIYINECSAKELKVNGTLMAAGGVIGHMEQRAYLFVNTLTDKTSEFNVSVTSDNDKNNASYPSNCGGIIGQLNNSNPTTIRNVTVTAAKDGCIGYSKKTTSSSFNGVGGAIGRANNGQVLLMNFKLKNVDLYGKNSAGLIGNTNGNLKFKAYNCTVEGNGNNKICGIEHVGGLFGYCNASNSDNIQYDGISFINQIDGCSVSGYMISQTTASNGAGGLIGTNNYSRNICNSKVENCTIKGGNSSSRIGGIIGNNTNGDISAYNIVVNGVTLSGSSSYYGLFSGYSNSKTFNIVGWSVQGTNSPDNKIFGGTSNTTTVIPADYNGACLDENAMGEKLSDITTDNISRVNKSDDNFPYATSSPAKNIGTGAKFLTGDGTSADAVKKIIAECEDKANLKHYTYTNIKNDIANYKQLTFSTEQDILKDIPVILIDNTNDISNQINSYLSILTNNTVSKASAVKVYKANISGDDVTLSTATENLTVNCSVTDKKFTRFQAKSDKFDSDTRGQFTLIDVQYNDPTVSKSTAVVYHVYVPVITRKIYQYEFFTTAFSGTQYYPSKYTNETGNNGFNGSNAKVLIENYNTPMTAYLRWAYPAETFIKDIMAGSSGLNWNYKKELSLTVNYGRTIPAGTQLVLIDKNNKNKEYYYTVTGKEEYEGLKLTLSLSNFTDSNDKAYSEATFADMVSSQLNFTKTIDESGRFVEDANGDMQVNINSEITTIRVANDSDINCFDLSTDTKYLTEDYYLTMTTAKEANVLTHQFQLTSPSSLYPNKEGKLNGAVKNNHSVQLNFADLFSNTIKVETLEDGNTNVEMTDENNNVNISTVSTITFNTTNATLINNLKLLLDTNRIPIYHSNHIFMKKRSVNDGAAEKIIGDTDDIAIIEGNNTVAAYDNDDKVISSPSTLNFTSVSGEPATNFFEVSEQNNGTAIDIRQWLTAGESGVAPTVKITTNFKIIYSHSGIITQFPERQQSDEVTNIGTYVSARSSLAFDADDTTYSNNVSATADDSIKCLYYRQAMTDVSLKYNAYHPVSSGSPDEDRGDGHTKANDQLGINVFDEGTERNAVIHTRGVFDASQLSAIDKKSLNIRWTIELQCKQDSYTDDLNLSDYLNSVTIKGVDEQPLKTFNSGELGKTKLEYPAARDKFEESDNAGLFDVYIDLDVKTGADLEKVNAFYSNYRIVLTASLCEGSTAIDGSTDNDYIIYTNAHLDAKFIDKVS